MSSLLTDLFSLLPYTSSPTLRPKTYFSSSPEIEGEDIPAFGHGYASSSSGSSDGARTPDFLPSDLSLNLNLEGHPSAEGRGKKKAVHLQKEAEECSRTWDQETTVEPELLVLPPPHPQSHSQSQKSSSSTLKNRKSVLPLSSILPASEVAHSQSQAQPLKPKVPSNLLKPSSSSASSSSTSSSKPLPATPSSSSLPQPHPHSQTLPIAKSRKTKQSPRSLPSSSTSRPLTPLEKQEEEDRGRSRWPRLLWASEVDREQLGVLERYHERAVGGPLPRLEGRGRKDVKEWSRRLEKAGL